MLVSLTTCFKCRLHLGKPTLDKQTWQSIIDEYRIENVDSLSEGLVAGPTIISG